jgi:hypothetical protein
MVTIMKEKSIFREKIFAIFLLAFSVLCSIAVALIVHANFNEFPEIDVAGMGINESVEFHIDWIENWDGYLHIIGWATEREEIDIVNCAVALRAKSTNIVNKMKTSMVKREDVSEYLNVDGTENSGFEACVNADMLLDNECYDLLLVYRNNGKSILVDTEIDVNYLGVCSYA